MPRCQNSIKRDESRADGVVWRFRHHSIGAARLRNENLDLHKKLKRAPVPRNCGPIGRRKAAPAQKKAPQKGDRSYVVQSRHALLHSRKFYKSPSAGKRSCRRTERAFAIPKKLTVGQTLVIPRWFGLSGTVIEESRTYSEGLLRPKVGHLVIKTLWFDWLAANVSQRST